MEARVDAAEAHRVRVESPETGVRAGKVAIAALIGAVLAWLSFLAAAVGPAVILAIWALVGIAIGTRCARVESLWVGACYGFVLSMVYLNVGYTGSLTWLGRLPGFLALSAFGAICGLLLALVGSLAAAAVKRRRAARPT